MRENAPASTRCKFACQSVTDYGNGYKKVEMSAEYDEPLSKEDRAFSDATPSGQMEFTISNPAVMDFFKPGTRYYLDVSPAD